MSVPLANEDDRDLSNSNIPPAGPNGDATSTSQKDQSKNVHVEKIKAADGTQQVLVSTAQQGVFGIDVSLEAMGTQYIGQIDSASLQQLSRDRTNVLVGVADSSEMSRAQKCTDKYGAGRLLTKGSRSV